MRPNPILLQKGDNVNIMYLAQVQIIHQHSVVLSLSTVMFYQEQALERGHCRTNNTHLREGKQATISSFGLYRKGIKYMFYEKQTSNYYSSPSPPGIFPFCY